MDENNKLDQDLDQVFLEEEFQEDPSDSEDFSSFKIKESYCMACEAPLKSYHSLICPDCLGLEAEKFSELVEELQEVPTSPLLRK